jgi:hypothetical protein
VTRGDFQTDVAGNITKRQAGIYDAAVTKGAKLRYLMGMSQEDAQEANHGVSLESKLPDWGPEEREGWDEWEKKPFYQNYLDTALSSLQLNEKVFDYYWTNTQEGQYFSNPYTVEGDPLKSQVSSTHILLKLLPNNSIAKP